MRHEEGRTSRGLWLQIKRERQSRRNGGVFEVDLFRCEALLEQLPGVTAPVLKAGFDQDVLHQSAPVSALVGAKRSICVAAAGSSSS